MKRDIAEVAAEIAAENLKDKIDRDSKPSVDEIPAYIPTEDNDDELIDEPELTPAENIFIGQDGTNYIIRASRINITVEDRKIKINGHVVAKYKTDAGVNAALKYVTDWSNNIANYKIFDINDWNTVFDDFDFAGGNEDKFVYIDDELTNPELDKTTDSLTRAMTIALENYQGFCRVGNLTAATNELSLYNICRNAMTELWKGEAA